MSMKKVFHAQQMAVCELRGKVYTACMHLLDEGIPAARLLLHVCSLGLTSLCGQYQA